MPSRFENGHVFDESDFPQSAEADTVAPANDARKAPITETDGRMGPGFFRPAQLRVYEADDTWTKPEHLQSIYVIAVGGGGGGFDDSNGKAGGGGAYSAKLVQAADLGATETVTVGEGGLGNPDGPGTPGTDGGDTSFGSHLTAGGGRLGDVGSGGTATGGDINIPGQAGYSSNAFTGVVIPGHFPGKGAGGFVGTNSNNGGPGQDGIVLV